MPNGTAGTGNVLSVIVLMPFGLDYVMMMMMMKARK